MDRITQVRFRNLRSIETLDLDLAPLTVLIGENGSGKSTIIEGLELLRHLAQPSFFSSFYGIHRGMPGLLRAGATRMVLGLVVEDSAGLEPRLEYEVCLASHGTGAIVSTERLRVGPLDSKSPPATALQRNPGRGELLDEHGISQPLDPALTAPDRITLASFGAAPPLPAIGRMVEVLRRIEVHLAFDTLAQWAALSVRRPAPLRTSGYFGPADRLELLGHNLPSAWSALKNDFGESHWQETMETVRLGLGDAIESINVRPDPGGGNIGLWLKRSDLDAQIPASNLSDGMLSWLAFIALARLNPGRTLLAFDEPELHLHPSLLGRVIALLAPLGDTAPVVLSTHSDRILELIEDPTSAVRVCELGPGGRTVLSKLDPTELQRWLDRYGDLGQLRASGYLERVLVRKEPRQ